MTATIAHTGRWIDGPLPPNVRLGQDSLITGQHAFKRFRSVLEDAIVIGDHVTLDAPHLSIGPRGRLIVGDWSMISAALLMAEQEIRIGRYVAIGWNASIADSDFHPIDPALRQQDAIACSPLSPGRTRPAVECRPVIIEDDVWIGPCATILKGVRVSAGAVIEPGAMVTRDVPSRARVAGNPARICGEV
jgi:acetyltransferase-like isoleucine patch superfamily enzyme